MNTCPLCNEHRSVCVCHPDLLTVAPDIRRALDAYTRNASHTSGDKAATTLLAALRPFFVDPGEILRRKAVHEALMARPILELARGDLAGLTVRMWMHETGEERDEPVFHAEDLEDFAAGENAPRTLGREITDLETFADRVIWIRRRDGSTVYQADWAPANT